MSDKYKCEKGAKNVTYVTVSYILCDLLLLLVKFKIQF